MDGKSREKLIVGIAALLFFAAFGAVAYLDRPHGKVGDDFGQDDFTAVIEKNEGHLSLPEFPSDLLIFGAGNEASLDFSVTNQDQDNDIDTVYITIPDGEVMNSTTEWFDPLFQHEWDFSKEANDVAKISARDDLPGRVFGGSAQYDVAGNIDDALDHNSMLGIDEGITITLDFKAPSIPGIKMGAKAINLQVSDEQTESSDSSNRYSVMPFPYPYIVIDTDYEFIIFRLTSNNADLDIEYGGSMLFGSGSRGSSIVISPFGFKYVSSDGSIVAVLEVPEDPITIINPLLYTTADGGGEFTLDMFKYRTLTVEPGLPSSEWVSILSSQEDYSGELPATAGGSIELDIDGDGLFNDNDDDIDGDGIINEEDSDPYDPGVVNHHPDISIQTTITSVARNKDLVIDTTATDEDQDTLIYSWSVSPDTGWTDNKASVTVDLDDFEPGIYTFMVQVSDGKGGIDHASITVEVTEPDETEGPPIWLIIIIIVVILVVVAAVVFYVLRNEEREEEVPEELEPHPLDGLEEDISATPPVEEYTGERYSATEDYSLGEVPGQELMEGEGEDELEEFEEEEEEFTEGVVEEVPSPVSQEYPGLPEESEMDEVKDLELLINEMEKAEEEIGDTCPECGGALGPYDASCPSCGAEFDIALECPNCGALIDEGAVSCPKCGTNFL